MVFDVMVMKHILNQAHKVLLNISTFIVPAHLILSLCFTRTPFIKTHTLYKVLLIFNFD